MEPVMFDNELSVKELMEYVFEQSDYCEPAGMEIVTALDVHRQHIVTDTSKKCKDELQGKGKNCFCVAYYLPSKFYFAEGGWGHHMEDMDAFDRIPNHVSIQFRFDDFRHTVVVNGDISLRRIYDYLVKTTYIQEDQVSFKFFDMGAGLIDLDTERDYLISQDGEVDLRTACKDYIEPVCIITCKN